MLESKAFTKPKKNAGTVNQADLGCHDKKTFRRYIWNISPTLEFRYVVHRRGSQFTDHSSLLSVVLNGWGLRWQLVLDEGHGSQFTVECRFELVGATMVVSACSSFYLFGL